IERERIILEMRRAPSKSCQHLFCTDYLTKNGTQVSALGRKLVITNGTKHEIAEKIYERLEPKIKSRTADINPIDRYLANKAIRTAIKVAVNRAVDTIIFNDDPVHTTTT
ncbi:unnamed protein product, partial [Didymodactylos carnosus]